jgi:hypothetical protein
LCGPACLCFASGIVSTITKIKKSQVRQGIKL